ncbi:MAG: alpha-galactosidase [Clostridia bacterium]|nr:alpha-galactosidase [Clostridia bacterium]
MYANFRRYSVRYDVENNTYSIYYDGKGEIVRGAGITEIVSKREPQVQLCDYGKPTASVKYSDTGAILSVHYSGAEMLRQDVELVFTIEKTGVTMHVGGEGTACVRFGGHVKWGEGAQKDIMAVNLKGAGRALRSAYGPAASIHDNALFDRDTDSAVVFETSGKFRLEYDWDADCYGFRLDTMGWDFARAFKVYVEKDVYARKFDIDYKKVNPNSTFKTPPVGWMTWYAVQFDAGEKTVLENTKWQEENLKRYGADTIWVDWEWYHRDFSSVGADDLDMYHPDPISYPNGLDYVAKKISEAGFIPALWVGPTCDPRKNEMIEKYPEAVMIRKPMWCGQYFLDPTHPKFLEEMLPKMIQQPKDWGYKAIKWDCLPNTTQLCDTCRDTRYEQNSSREAMLGAFKKAREVLGDDYYMLYCAGSSERDMDLACAVFDAARIGGDIFRWEEFITQCIDKVHKYYMLHTVACNNDPDNVVIREKFNTYDQAVTRAALVSLLGMPFTLGDNLPDLPEDRVEILRRSIPPVPAHPMDVRSTVSDHKTVILNLAVERPDMRCNIADVINLDTEASTVRVDLRADMGLDDGAYYVYDYWNKKFLGVFTDSFEVELRPCASRIFAVHKVKDEPQVISTSRHIAQGVLDIVSVKYDEKTKTIYGESNVVGGEDYEVVVCADESLRIFGESDRTSTNLHEHIGGNAWRCIFKPEKDGLFKWSVCFHPNVKPLA